MKILDNIEDIGIWRFTDKDVVRHKLVQAIILAYEARDRERAKELAEKPEQPRYKRMGDSPYRRKDG